MDLLLRQRYEVRQEIGSGGFGRVYIGYDQISKSKVAIKLEKINVLEGEVSSLKKEKEVYSKLNGEESIGISNIHLFGADLMDEDLDYGCVLHYMVMDLLGPDLEQLFTECSDKFSLKTVLLLADQMIQIVQYVHSKDYIHGDIKPGNFVIGRGKTRRMIYMVDFGLAQRYRYPQTKEHICYSDTASCAGTTKFTSLNCHQYIQQSRRDDLESLGYVLLYFLRGSLPWQDIKGSEQSEKQRLVYEKKASISTEELCTDVPYEFINYMEYCRSLQFEEEPDYDRLRKLFQDLYDQSNFTDVLEYDWTVTGKDSGIRRFLNDSVIHASKVQPWEMKSFLQVSYSTFPSIYKIDEASVEQHVEEAFRFRFPDGVPSYFTRYYTSEVTWKSVVPWLCSEFFAVKGDWLKDNFKMDYTKKTDYREQEISIIEGVNHTSNEFTRLSADLALTVHRMITSLHSDTTSAAPSFGEQVTHLHSDSTSATPSSGEHVSADGKQKNKSDNRTHDLSKFMIYQMLSYAGVNCLTNGYCEYNFHLRRVPLRDKKKGGITVIARPDTVPCIQHHLYTKDAFPYCPVQVYGPYRPEGSERLTQSSPCKRSHTNATSSDCNLTSKYKELSHPVDAESGLDIKDYNLISEHKEPAVHSDVESGSDNKEHDKINKEIKDNCPFKDWSAHPFSKVTGQLIMEMYSVLVKEESLLTTCGDRPCECMGMFVMNENLYLAKMTQSRQAIEKILTLHDSKVSGPGVCYSDWYFNFQKPNDRLGFLIFMYHYKVIVNSDKKYNVI